MNKKPAYFEYVRLKAEKRWKQLEQDPELAGPWHQLFRQVQNPRHVLSELLQNADDAYAAQACVRIKDQVFIFEHDGDDFTQEHLESLCRFGYSNKRTMRTIGFRGIGFKSTFSLGDRVELFTPSLSISFHSRRFTEPEWIEPLPDTDGRTRIRVQLSDWNRQCEIEKNLEEWLRSPISLLFFKNISSIQIGYMEVIRDDLGQGPIPNSRKFDLHGETEPVLLIRSEAEEFPRDALDEIRRERSFGDWEKMEFPPCEVEIVLGTQEQGQSAVRGLTAAGTKGRLHAVLPTSVETTLPFACNAPFIQNPDRLVIKDPAISPTNHWLLERVGKLAASSMLHWLDREEISLDERCHAYCLLPNHSKLEYALEGRCGNIVHDAFAKAVEGQDILLTEDGDLVPKKRSIVIPPPALDVWMPDQIATLLGTRWRPALCHSIKDAEREKLVQWDLVDEIDEQDILDVLRQKRPPKPETWSHLLTLWEFVEDTNLDYTSYRYFRIVPVQGKDALYAASEVVRLGKTKLLNSTEDWKFLAEHLLVLNQNWTRFLRKGATPPRNRPKRHTLC